LDQGLLTTLGRRSAQRICVRCDVGILDPETGERMLGKLRDLSSNGCRVLTPRPLPIGEGLRLAFEFHHEQEPVRLHAEVVWSGRDESGAAMAGLRYLDLAGTDFGRLRSFIDRRLWAVQRFLCGLEPFADLNDLEKLLLASVSFDLELEAGESLDDSSGENAFLIVRSGEVTCEEVRHDGRRSPKRTLRAGETAGTPPIDPRGASRLEVTAVGPAALLVVPADGFGYLWSQHAETALKLLACWCLTLRDRLLVAEGVS
jgi:hypothetical protein